MPAHIHINDDMFNDAKSMAKETYERFKGRAGYYNNTCKSHLVGKIGELASAQWAANLNIPCDAAFRDPNRMSEADLGLHLDASRTLRVEVKCWSAEHWLALGRCVSVAQMPQVRAKAHIVIWCIVTPLMDLLLKKAGDVEILGWNKIGDIAQTVPMWTGPTGGRQVHNHQVPIEHMRPLDSLVTLVRPSSQ